MRLDRASPVALTVGRVHPSRPVDHHPPAVRHRVDAGGSAPSPVMMSVEARSRVTAFVGRIVRARGFGVAAACDARIDIPSVVASAIGRASPRRATLRHEPYDVVKVAERADALLGELGIPGSEVEGTVVLHTSAGLARPAPGSTVVLRREVDGWRLVAVWKVCIEGWTPERFLLATRREILEAADPEVDGILLPFNWVRPYQTGCLTDPGMADGCQRVPPATFVRIARNMRERMEESHRSKMRAFDGLLAIRLERARSAVPRS